ncbi:MAG: hypothetical protein GY851_00490 [bacterium]|nr:hypothetical protein [bacterium]
MPKYVSTGESARPPAVLLPVGQYAFEVAEKDTEEGISQAGNDKITVHLVVDGGELGVAHVWESLTFSENSFWKIDAFMASTGHALKKGEEIELTAEDCIGRKGWVSLKIEEYDKKERNRVDMFINPPADAPSTDDEPADADDSDDLKF